MCEEMVLLRQGKEENKNSESFLKDKRESYKRRY